MIKNHKQSTARATMLGICAVTALTVLSGAVSWETVQAKSLQETQQVQTSTNSSTEMKKLYEKMQTGKNPKATRDLMDQLIKMDPADVHTFLKTLSLDISPGKDHYVIPNPNPNGLTDILYHQTNKMPEFELAFYLENCTVPKDFKVEFQPQYYVFYKDKGKMAHDHRVTFDLGAEEEQVKKFKEEHAEEIKQGKMEVVYISDIEEAKKRAPGSFLWQSAKKEHIVALKGMFDGLKRLGFDYQEVSSGDVQVRANKSGKIWDIGLNFNKLYPNHEVSFALEPLDKNKMRVGLIFSKKNSKQ